MLVLYQPRSEHRLTVEELVREYKSQYPDSTVQMLDVDQPDGTALAKLYGVVRYPSIMVIKEDGGVIESWDGESELPRIEDINYYASSNI